MDLIFRRSEIGREFGIALLATGAGGLTGLLSLDQGPVKALAIIALPVAILTVLRSIWVAFAAVIAVVTLLPYAVIPAGASVTPSLLETTQLVTVALLAALILIDRRARLLTGLPQALVTLLLGVMVFAFLLGLGRGYSSQTMHDFFKYILAIATFWVVIQLVSTIRDARRLLTIVITGVASSAALGLLLYVGGVGLTERVLLRLVPYGYPGSGVARFIEDDPSKAMRAIGTGVDPNSLGGLLMVGFVLATGQLVVPRRSVSVWLAVAGCAVITPALALTYSRGAWLGALAGLLVIIALRRPWLLLPSVIVGGASVMLGLGSGFVNRLWLGFTLQDPATKLRLSEYENAWQIIRQHPWFGVGFGDAPSIELQAGVSSIYLTIAEQAGLVGLATFLVVVATILMRGLRGSVRHERRHDEQSDMLLCWTAAFVAALTVGVVDHYFSNPPFAHMATLFWLVAGSVIRTSLPLNDETATYTQREFGLSSERANNRLRPRLADSFRTWPFTPGVGIVRESDHG